MLYYDISWYNKLYYFMIQYNMIYYDIIAGTPQTSPGPGLRSSSHVTRWCVYFPLGITARMQHSYVAAANQRSEHVNISGLDPNMVWLIGDFSPEGSPRIPRPRIPHADSRYVEPQSVKDECQSIHTIMIHWVMCWQVKSLATLPPFLSS